MAKTRKTRKGDINKSQAIRDLLASNKKANGPEIVAALADKGISVSLPLVYAQLAKSGRRKTRRGKTTRGPKTTRGGSDQIAIDALIAANRMVQSLGGLEKARHALDVLAKLS